MEEGAGPEWRQAEGILRDNSGSWVWATLYRLRQKLSYLYR